MMKNIVFCLMMFFSLFYINNAFCNPTNTKKNELSRISNYLNSLKTFSTEFSLVNKGNLINSGVIYFENGKLRINISFPEELVFIVKNDVITFYNVDLDEITYFKTTNDLTLGPILNTLQQPTKILNLPNYMAKDSLVFTEKNDTYAFYFIFKITNKLLLLNKITIEEKENMLNQTIYLSNFKRNIQIPKHSFSLIKSKIVQ